VSICSQPFDGMKKGHCQISNYLKVLITVSGVDSAIEMYEAILTI
jgi:hypothetical protein